MFGYCCKGRTTIPCFYIVLDDLFYDPCLRSADASKIHVRSIPSSLDKAVECMSCCAYSCNLYNHEARIFHLYITVYVRCSWSCRLWQCAFFLMNVFTLPWVGDVYYHFVHVAQLLNSHSDLYHLVFVDIGALAILTVIICMDFLCVVSLLKSKK